MNQPKFPDFHLLLSEFAIPGTHDQKLELVSIKHLTFPEKRKTFDFLNAVVPFEKFHQNF